jgi:periplasmic divalent cation tolerance protein
VSDQPDRGNANSPSGVSLVLCTAPVDEARALADRLLEDRLAACVNLIGPITSRYWWQGAIEEGTEMLLLIKTPTAAVARLRARIEELHSYSTPEVLEVRADGGAPEYLGWVLRTCST